jgi:hypothetical protein
MESTRKHLAKINFCNDGLETTPIMKHAYEHIETKIQTCHSSTGYVPTTTTGLATSQFKTALTFVNASSQLWYRCFRQPLSTLRRWPTAGGTDSLLTAAAQTSHPSTNGRLPSNQIKVLQHPLLRLSWVSAGSRMMGNSCCWKQDLTRE